VAHSQIVGKVI